MTVRLDSSEREFLITWAKRLIACPSVSEEGTRKIVELCAKELFEPVGIYAQILPSRLHGADQANLIITLQGTGSRDLAPLVLNTHLDTVPPGDFVLWTECDGDPFNPKVRDGRIYGLGAADTKLDFVAKAWAVIRNRQPLRTVYLVATFGEESGLRGAKELVQSGLLPSNALAFIGEPSSLALILGHRGMSVFRLVVDGETDTVAYDSKPYRVSFVGLSAHSSVPTLGRNAIELALRYLWSNPSLQMAWISGGDAVNKVPAHCEALILSDTPLDLASCSEYCRVEAWDMTARGGRVERIFNRQIIGALLSFSEALSRYTRGKASTLESFAHQDAFTHNIGLIRGQGTRVEVVFEVRNPPDYDTRRVKQDVEELAAKLKSAFPKLRINLELLRANPGFYTSEADETVLLAQEAMVRAGIEPRTAVKLGCTEAGIYAEMGMKPVVFGPGPSAGVIHAPNEYNIIDELEKAAQFYQTLLTL